MAEKSGAKWVDILRPKEKDLDWLKQKFHVHPLILDELAKPSARSRVEAYDRYLYMIYYFPVYDPREQTSRRTEIDFLITRSAVVTVRYEEFEAFTGAKEFAAEDSLKLTYKIVEALLNFQERQLRHIREEVETIGKELFQGREKEVLRKISRLKRDISEYRVIVGHQGVILKSLARRGRFFWSEEEQVYLDDLVGEHLKILNQADDYRDAISDFEDTNNQLMNLKIAEVMRTFTALSFMTFPFVLFAAIFTMKTQDTPIVGYAHGFWVLLGAMAAGMLGMFAYFRKKGWL